MPRSTVELLDPELHDDPWIDHGELDALLRDPTVLATTASPTRDDATGTEGSRPEGAQPETAQPGGTITRAVKLAGLVVATALLCGAIATAPALVDASPEPARTATLDAGTATGMRALLATAAPPLGDATAGASPSTGNPEPISPDSATDRATDRAPQPSQREQEAGSTAADSPPSAEDVVRTFYDRVATDPEGAIAMLTDEVVEASIEPSRASRAHIWRTASDLEVHELRIQSDDVIRALVTLTDPTGARLRLDQLLHVSTEPEPRITEVRLLSSQHVPLQGS
ncbi:hypothetical protein [Haloechinothrix alba]|uniref:hypothetical protein n=1 Tax=Haloechinothrix alba TaxID=664784 RepID=UPI000B794DAE|nr:hypothetical protein [Haloechinothrix alba]